MLPWQVYERAIAHIPPAPEKRYWQRYIYLWINYALFEELEAQDMDRTREVYRACLKLLPHKAFTFAKVHTHTCTHSLKSNCTPACTPEQPFVWQQNLCARGKSILMQQRDCEDTTHGILDAFQAWEATCA